MASFCLSSCSHSSHSDPSSLTFLIESSPTNLDPRFATDLQSQRLDGLLFSGLLERDNQMNFHGDLAESWETPNPVTYVCFRAPTVAWRSRLAFHRQLQLSHDTSSKPRLTEQNSHPEAIRSG